MACKGTRRAGLPYGRSQHGAKKSQPDSIVSPRDISVKRPSRNLSERSQAARARALHVLADLRRDPAKNISQIARDREVSLRTIQRYIGSELLQERPGGRITATKSDRLTALLQIPTTRPGVIQEIHARGSKERYLVGEWIAAMKEAAGEDFTRLDRFPRGQFLDGVRLPTGHYEVQRIIEAMEAAEKPFEDLYALGGGA